MIFAHRGNVNGPDTIDLDECARQDWGVELDLRWDAAGWYFDHTPRGPFLVTDARDILFRSHSLPKAINIKEVGHEADAVSLLESQPGIFVFDMELCGADPEAYAGLTRAARVSDRYSEREPQFEAVPFPARLTRQ